jgi:hypothetical protein
MRRPAWNQEFFKGKVGALGVIDHPQQGKEIAGYRVDVAEASRVVAPPAGTGFQFGSGQVPTDLLQRH